MSGPPERILTGRTVLVVEDEYVIARHLAGALREAGAKVVGPARDIPSAMRLIASEDGIDAATLDLNLQGTPSYPVIDMLLARGVALLLVSGYDRDSIPNEYLTIPRQQKPLTAHALTSALASITAGEEQLTVVVPAPAR